MQTVRKTIFFGLEPAGTGRVQFPRLFLLGFRTVSFYYIVIVLVRNNALVLGDFGNQYLYFDSSAHSVFRLHR